MDWIQVWTGFLYAGMIYTCYDAAMLPLLLLPLVPFGRVWGWW